MKLTERHMSPGLEFVVGLPDCALRRWERVQDLLDDGRRAVQRRVDRDDRSAEARRQHTVLIDGILAWDGSTFVGATGIDGASEDGDYIYFTRVKPGART
jgi:hypothetical protein